MRSRLVGGDWGSPDLRRFSTGDGVIQRTKKGRGFEFEPPARLIMIEPYSSGRGAVLFLERRKRLPDVSSADLRAHLGVAAKYCCPASTSPQVVRSAPAVANALEPWPAFCR